VGGDRQERVARLERLTHFAVQARVVHRQGAVARQLLGQRQVLSLERLSRRAAGERERAKESIVCPERHDHHRLKPDRSAHGQVGVIAAGLLQVVLADISQEDRLSGTQHLRHRLSTLRVGRVLLLELPEHLLLRGIRMRRRQPAGCLPLLDDGDAAPVGEHGDGDPCHAFQRLLVHQRRGENRTGFIQQPQLRHALLERHGRFVDPLLELGVLRANSRVGSPPTRARGGQAGVQAAFAPRRMPRLL
jgi:hypothetical protein